MVVMEKKNLNFKKWIIITIIYVILYLPSFFLLLPASYLFFGYFLDSTLKNKENLIPCSLIFISAILVFVFWFLSSKFIKSKKSYIFLLIYFIYQVFSLLFVLMSF